MISFYDYIKKLGTLDSYMLIQLTGHRPSLEGLVKVDDETLAMLKQQEHALINFFQRSQVFNIDNVISLFKNIPPDFTIYDIPCFFPPFSETWMEYDNNGYIDTNGSYNIKKVGALILRDKPDNYLGNKYTNFSKGLDENGEENILKINRGELESKLSEQDKVGIDFKSTQTSTIQIIVSQLIQNIDGDLLRAIGPYGAFSIAVNEKGKPCQPIVSVPYEHILGDIFRTPKKMHSFLNQMSYIGLPFFYTLGLLNTKNSVVIEKKTDSFERRKYKQNNGIEMTKFKILDLKKMSSSVRYINTEKQKTDQKRPEHVQRGHWRDYRDNGLFGRHKDIFWFGENLQKGNKDLGRIEKTYKVK